MRGSSPWHCMIMRLHGDHRFFLLTKRVSPFILMKADEIPEMFLFLRVWKHENLGEEIFIYKLKLSCSTQTKHK